MSERGDSRSCGSVSQPGNVATEFGGRNAPSAAVRSSASRAVAVTASTKRPRPSGATVPAASAATSSGRSADGATRSRSPAPGVSGRASAVRSCGIFGYGGEQSSEAHAVPTSRYAGFPDAAGAAHPQAAPSHTNPRAPSDRGARLLKCGRTPRPLSVYVLAVRVPAQPGRRPIDGGLRSQSPRLEPPTARADVRVSQALAGPPQHVVDLAGREQLLDPAEPDVARPSEVRVGQAVPV